MTRMVDEIKAWEKAAREHYKFHPSILSAIEHLAPQIRGWADTVERLVQERDAAQERFVGLETENARLQQEIRRIRKRTARVMFVAAETFAYLGLCDRKTATRYIAEIVREDMRRRL
jgi:hypothetical protein